MCGPEPCTSPTPCGRCERGTARLAAIEFAARPRNDDASLSAVARLGEPRITRVLRVMPPTSD